MKSRILQHTVVALLVAAPLAQAEDKNQAASSTTASSTVVTSADGTATVTIDINGKKETRTFKLGGGNNVIELGADGQVKPIGGGALVRRMDAPGAKAAAKGPWVGLALEPVSDLVRAQLPLAPGEGVVASAVVPESPAAQAGLEENDILLRFDEQILVEPSQFKKLVLMKQPGDPVKLVYLRKGERRETTARLVEHELEPADSGKSPWAFVLPGGKDWQQPKQFDEIRKRFEEQEKKFKEQAQKFKERVPGIIVDRQSWITGAGEQAIREQIEKLERALENSSLPREQIEDLKRQLERAARETKEAVERARLEAEESIRKAKGALERAVGGGGKEKEAGGEKREQN